VVQRMGSSQCAQAAEVVREAEPVQATEPTQTEEPTQAVTSQTLEPTQTLEPPQASEPLHAAESTQVAEPAQVTQPAQPTMEAAEPAQVAEAASTSVPVSTPFGSIREVVNEPLVEVPHDSSWISVIGLWIFLIPVLVSGIIAGLCPKVYVCIAIGSCLPWSQRFCSAVGHVMRGRPLSTAFTMWRGLVATLTALIANRHSRLGLYLWEWKAFGSGRWFWHGEGVWCHSYRDCDKILQEPQLRQVAFGAMKAPAPDLYAARLLIFLSNESADCEWAAIRRLLHNNFLDHNLESFKSRMKKLPELLATDWKDAKLADLSNLPLVRTNVSKCIFYMIFNVWPKKAEAEILAKWRDYAKYFILPRLAHRLIFNLAIGKVKSLREQTVGLVEKYGKQDMFITLNNNLGDYKRKSPVHLCDEILFAIGFAGIGGTCAAIESVGAFLQVTFPEESPGEKYIKWGQYSDSALMVQKYIRSPERYIRETCRMDPPVTSATTSLAAKEQVTLAGKEFSLGRGTLNQYALSIANRDETLFPRPDEFNPDRDNLEKALTWNGAFGAENEASYPRMCPGRHLALQLVETVVNHALNLAPPSEEAA
jgi:hypothetical protein